MITKELQAIDAHQLKEWIHDDEELALLDVREHGQYGDNHLFFAVSLPFSELELKIGRLVPRKNTRIVVYGDVATTEAVDASAHILCDQGYTSVSMLNGGISAWQKAGYSTFSGVNLPSKTFGELAEQVYETPRITAEELYERLGRGNEDIVVLDGRPVHEYRKMNIPSAVCCPNGELALRVDALVPNPSTTIVVNCAGRTRSIIGAQTLINLELPNQVYALENGTQGWYLADFPLEHASDRIYPEEVDTKAMGMQRERSSRLARRYALESINAEQVSRWQHEDGRTVFICDVRTKEEFLNDELPLPIQHAAGGQLIQATDKYVGVRKARIVLYDPDGIRAPVVASWLKQLGWEVYLLPELAGMEHCSSNLSRGAPVDVPNILPREALSEFIVSYPDLQIFDARPSQEFRKACVARSIWVVRPTLLREAESDKHRTILLLGQSLSKLALLAKDLKQKGFSNVYAAIVDTEYLLQSNLPLRPGGGVLSDERCIDYLFFVHDRHDGNKEAARKYLEWETNLVFRLDERERNTFSIGK